MKIFKAIKTWWNRKETKRLQDLEKMLLALSMDYRPFNAHLTPNNFGKARIPHLSEFKPGFSYYVNKYTQSGFGGWFLYIYDLKIWPGERTEILEALEAGYLITEEPYLNPDKGNTSGLQN